MWQHEKVSKKYWLPLYPSFEDAGEQVIFDSIYAADAHVAADRVISEVVDTALDIIGEALLKPIAKKHGMQT